MRALLLCVIALAVAMPAAAQPRQPQPQAPQDKREAVKKKIRAMRAYTLTEELSLDEKSAAKLFPILSKWDDVTDKLLVQRVDIQKRLNQSGNADPKTLDKIIDEAVANQKAFWDLETQRLAEMRKVLTPAQTARLLVVLPAFERKIQNQLKRAINRRGGGERRANQDDMDEDDLDPDKDDVQPPKRR
jgi:Spy/CpxP family protein refolding chaperone